MRRAHDARAQLRGKNVLSRKIFPSFFSRSHAAHLDSD
jgi:hypothetical protein